MIKSYVFNGPKPGKRLLILGAIHGNEICGQCAIERLREKIENGEVVIQSGEVTAVPVCNENAFRENIRYTTENLNRVFYWSADGDDFRETLGGAEIKKMSGKKPVNYEQERALEIAQFFREKDAMIDIHSQHVDGEPYCFAQNNSPELTQYLSALGTENVIFDWDKMYPEGDFTTENLAEKSNILGTTVECGEHAHQDSIEVAWRTILRAMKYLNIISDLNFNTEFAKLPAKFQAEKTSRNVYMFDMIRFKKGAKLAKNWQHLESIKTGELIATFADGTKFCAPKNCVMILPNLDPAHENDEWFYLAETRE